MRVRLTTFCVLLSLSIEGGEDITGAGSLISCFIPSAIFSSSFDLGIWEITKVSAGGKDTSRGIKLFSDGPS